MPPAGVVVVVVEVDGPGTDVPRCLLEIIRSIQSNCSGENGVSSVSVPLGAPGSGSVEFTVHEMKLKRLAC